MTKMKKIVTLGAAVLTMATISVNAFAASKYANPAEIVAGLTGKSIETVIAERRNTGKTYGTIASEAGKLDEFKTESLEMKKDRLSAQVAAGQITQAQANEIIKAIEENQTNCDGSGSAGIGCQTGAGFGCQTGSGFGMGRGQGMGRGRVNR